MGYRPTIGYLGVSDMWYTIYPSEITHPFSWEIPPSIEELMWIFHGALMGHFATKT